MQLPPSYVGIVSHSINTIPITHGLFEGLPTERMNRFIFGQVFQEERNRHTPPIIILLRIWRRRRMIPPRPGPGPIPLLRMIFFLM